MVPMKSTKPSGYWWLRLRACPARSARSRLISLTWVTWATRKPSAPSTTVSKPMRRAASRVKVLVEQPEEGPDRARGIVVLRAREEQRAPALDVSQVDVVAEADGDDRARVVDDEHQLGLGIVPDRGRMDAHAGAQAHRGHGRALREQLRVGPDAHLEVLRPHALGDEHVLDAGGFGGARLDAAEIGPDDGLDLSSHALGQRGVAPRPLLDDALEEARDERHAARLDRVQVARREEPRLRRIAPPLDAIGDDVRDRARETAPSASRRARPRGRRCSGAGSPSGRTASDRRPRRRARPRRMGPCSAGTHARPTSKARPSAGKHA